MLFSHKKDEIRTLAATWIIIILSEITRIQENKYCRFPLLRKLNRKNTFDMNLK